MVMNSLEKDDVVGAVTMEMRQSTTRFVLGSRNYIFLIHDQLWTVSGTT
jgi:hypothetical protein